MSFGEGWFLTIESIIKRKFKIKNPIFIVDKQKWDRNKIIHWAEHIIEEERWIKYKHLSEDIFELKDFSPDPSNQACKKVALEFINWVKDYVNQSHKQNDFYFKNGHAIYSEKEIMQELLFQLRRGQASLGTSVEKPLPDPKPNSNRLIFSLWDSWAREIDIDIEEGFLELENKL